MWFSLVKIQNRSVNNLPISYCTLGLKGKVLTLKDTIYLIWLNLTVL